MLEAAGAGVGGVGFWNELWGVLVGSSAFADCLCWIATQMSQPRRDE